MTDNEKIEWDIDLNLPMYTRDFLGQQKNVSPKISLLQNLTDLEKELIDLIQRYLNDEESKEYYNLIHESIRTKTMLIHASAAVMSIPDTSKR